MIIRITGAPQVLASLWRSAGLPRCRQTELRENEYRRSSSTWR